jgi:HlyD family secretion protein
MPYLLPEPPADSASYFGLNPNTTPFGGRRKRSGELILLTVLVAVMAVASFFALRRKDVASPKYLLGLVSRGPLMESVRATGTVQPLSQVQVGAQVSGRIVRVRVDFNSKVKVGDLLGEIDPIPYRAQVAHESNALLAARAQAQGRANAALAEANVTRQHRLRDQPRWTPQIRPLMDT